MFCLTIFFSLMVINANSLTCNVGSNDAFSSLICATGLSCVKAFLLTGAMPSWNVSQVNNGSGTEVYACGNCTIYQVDLNNTVVHSASCCNTDNCFVPNGPSPVGTCDAIPLKSDCTNRTGSPSSFHFMFGPLFNRSYNNRLLLV